MPSEQHTALFVADPRPCTRIPSRRQNWTISQNDEKVTSQLQSFDQLEFAFDLAVGFFVMGTVTPECSCHRVTRSTESIVSPGATG